MRFEVSRTNDAIEERLSLDPLLAEAVVDLAEMVRLPGFAGDDRPKLTRLGLVVDALTRYLADGSAALYAIAARSLLSDLDLTSNERMVMRRWADDGLIEVVPALEDRLSAVAAEIGRPVISSRVPVGRPVRTLSPTLTGGVITLVPDAAGASPQPAGPTGLLTRIWHCPQPECAGFAAARSASPVSQPPPALRRGRPVCPRHDVPVIDAGPRPTAVALVVRAAGVIRQRFVVTAGRPVIVGRSPDDPTGVTLGPLLDEEGNRRVSREHLRLDLVDQAVVATDISTNGSAVLTRTGPRLPARRLPLSRGQAYRLGGWDSVEVHEGFDIGYAGRLTDAALTRPASVMTDAPTVAMRLPMR